jgi:hypothetical protein
VIGAKAAAGVATAALLTAGAVEVNNYVGPEATPAPKEAGAQPVERAHHATVNVPVYEPTDVKKELAVDDPAASPEPAAEQTGEDAATPPAEDPAAGDPAAESDTAGDSGASSGPTVTGDVPVAPAASYTPTSGTVVEVPSSDEAPPADAPPVSDPPPPPLPPESQPAP